MSPLGSKIRKEMTKAISEYGLIEPGDNILVAVSGGKDSAVMLLMLEELRRRAPFRFSIEAVLLDQKQPGFSVAEFQSWLLSEHGLGLTVLEEDTYSVVKAKTAPGKSFCGLCSRLRRGILYTYARNNAFTKIALGHHRDDLNETLLMNLFYGGKLSAMAPKLEAADGLNCVVRPMVWVPEAWLASYAAELAIPVIPCSLCGNQDGLKRSRMKALIQELSVEYDQVASSMSRALANVAADRLLDRRLVGAVPRAGHGDDHGDQSMLPRFNILDFDVERDL